MHNFDISEEARIDLSKIKKYTKENFGPDQADSYMTALFDGINIIRTHPKLGYKLTLKHRSLFCYNIEHHRIIYKIVADTVVILSVLHKRQLPMLHLSDRMG